MLRQACGFVVYEVRSKTDERMSPRTRRSLIAGCVLTSKQSLDGSGSIGVRIRRKAMICTDDPSLQQGRLLPAPG